MTWENGGALAAALLTVLAAALQLWRGRDGGRARIKQDLEIAALLDPALFDPASPVRARLARNAEARVVALVRVEEEARRDEIGIVTAAICVGVGSIFGALAVSSGNVWRFAVAGLLALFFVTLGVYGAVLSIPRRVRDAKGIPVKDGPAGA